MKNSAVPIVFATDNGFAPFCAVSIASLIMNCNKSRQYQIYVFYDQLSSEHMQKLKSMEQNNISIELVQVSQYVDRELFYVRDHFTLAAYFRFFVVDVFPQYDKILYLDSDIVILGDVGELYDIDIGDNLLGAVVIFRNKPHEIALKAEYLRETIQISPEEYFNSGILSMNLKRFRSDNIKEKCFEYLKKHRNLRWMDQDVLNGVCKGQVYYLPEKWNKSQFYFEEDLLQNLPIEENRIIHYLTEKKPCKTPFRQAHIYFYQYALLTQYCDQLLCSAMKANRSLNLSGPTESEIKNRILGMSEHLKVGPRFFSRCLVRWMRSKYRQMICKLH